MTEFDGKVALITGGGSGIGRATALSFAREGAQVIIGNRNVERGEETVAMIRKAGGTALVTPTDVSKREQVLAWVEAVERELGPISVLINNAGAYLKKKFTEIAEDEFDEIVPIRPEASPVIAEAKHQTMPELQRKAA